MNLLIYLFFERLKSSTIASTQRIYFFRTISRPSFRMMLLYIVSIGALFLVLTNHSEGAKLAGIDSPLETKAVLETRGGISFYISYVILYYFFTLNFYKYFLINHMVISLYRIIGRVQHIFVEQMLWSSSTRWINTQQSD